MAEKFVLVRLIDDHSQTRELAERSLPSWSHLWERVPDDELPEPVAFLRPGRAAPQQQPGEQQTQAPPDTTTADSAPSEPSAGSADPTAAPTRKSRSRAADETKE